MLLYIRRRINDAQPVDCIPILDLLLKRLAPPVQLSHPTIRLSSAYRVAGDQFVEDIALVFPWGMNDPNADQMSMSVAPLPGVHPVAMSRPQVGIERLPTRRMSNEPREGIQPLEVTSAWRFLDVYLLTSIPGEQ